VHVEEERVLGRDRPAARAIRSRTSTRSGSLAYAAAKRAIDLVGCVLLLPVALPVVLLSMLAISVSSSGHPIYAQVRVGRDGRKFRIYKLRTMVRRADRIGPELTQHNDPRVTRAGRFLRRWSLDELPQLANVLLGQMSLIGPRPDLPSIIAMYTPEQREVLSVKPGISGWSQVHGRDDLSLQEKLELDRWYVHNRSLRMDVQILFKTIPTLFSGRGVKR
jgi:lipopolysaccharide/colanic/teichoic acid biosynthesis glycosyltransferase